MNHWKLNDDSVGVCGGCATKAHKTKLNNCNVSIKKQARMLNWKLFDTYNPRCIRVGWTASNRAKKL